MGKTIHVISHTHWDREWYFTVDDSKILMNKAFDDILNALEDNKEFSYYMLDAQTSIIEEYLSLKPEKEGQLRKLITDGRLITGPWYTQPDVFNIHGESIIRNLLIGMEQAESFGKTMKIGYLPDTFGFNAQMPLIYKEVGINKAVIRRGYDPKILSTTEFDWLALDGESSVFTSVQPFGYSMGHPRRGARNRDFNKEQLYKETYPLLEKVKKLSSSSQVMLTIGGDQVSVDKDINLFIEKLKENASSSDDVFIQSNLEKYFDSLEEDLDKPQYSGEFRSPRYARVHRTIGSSRYDIKRANYEAEQHLLRVTEVINAISSDLGLYHDVENTKRAWKLLLESHAHDSMGGCNSDATNKIVLERCMNALHTSKGIFALSGRLLARNIDREGYESNFIVLNGSLISNAKGSRHTIMTSTEQFNIVNVQGEKVKYVLLNQKPHQKARKIELTEDGEKESLSDEFYYENEIMFCDVTVPVLGYTTFYIQPSIEPTVKLEKQTEMKIETEKFVLYVEDGHLFYYDKSRKLEIKDFITFEDCADDGDLYDFSPLVEDEPYILNKINRSSVYAAEGMQKLTIVYQATLPEKINDSRTKREGAKEVEIAVSFTLANELLSIDVSIDNIICDHRMRMIVNTQIKTSDVEASLPFGMIRREKQVPESNWQELYGECPIDIEPMNEFIRISDDTQAALIFARGCKEYQLLENGEIAITLFKSVGKLGKPDLVYRPGRESGRDVDTPEAQLLEKLEFKVGIRLDQPEWMGKNLAHLVEVFEAPFASYQAQDFKRNFQQMDYFDVFVPEHECPKTYQLIQGDVPEGLVFSSITALDEEKLLRFANYNNFDLSISSKKIVGAAQASVVDYLGRDKKNQQLVHRNSSLTIRF